MLRIRPYKTSDAAHITHWLQNEKEHAFWCANLIQYPLTKAKLEELRVRYDAKDEGALFTATDENGTPIGFFVVMSLTYATNNAHVGFILVAPEKRGHGYGKKLVQKALDYCFDLLEANSVTLKVHETNTIARACYQSVGFKEVAHQSKDLVFKQEVWKTKNMIITRKSRKRKEHIYDYKR